MNKYTEILYTIFIIKEEDIMMSMIMLTGLIVLLIGMNIQEIMDKGVA